MLLALTYMFSIVTKFLNNRSKNKYVRIEGSPSLNNFASSVHKTQEV